VTLQTRLVTAATIPGESGEFDAIYGNGVLHHVQLDEAIPELARVMKPDGVGCFIEPLSYNPIIDVYRRLADTVRTPDERPLTFEDIDRMKRSFSQVSHREFWLLSLAIFGKFFLIDRADPSKERYWKKIITDAPANEWWFRHLPALDEQILRLAPPLRRLCWNTVIRVEGPAHRHAGVASDGVSG
jgi:SAM-dependent methyltransferase